MFCGLPTSVATLPVLEAVASASKNGSRGRFQRSDPLDDERREQHAHGVVGDDGGKRARAPH